MSEIGEGGGGGWRRVRRWVWVYYNGVGDVWMGGVGVGGVWGGRVVPRRLSLPLRRQLRRALGGRVHPLERRRGSRRRARRRIGIRILEFGT